MTVEAQRATGGARRVAAESFPVATIPSDADRRCRRALGEEWVGRETAAFRLPPSQLALDPGDVIDLVHDGRLIGYCITSLGDAGARTVEAMRTDAALYGLAPGPERSAQVSGPTVFGPPTIVLLDLPQRLANSIRAQVYPASRPSLNAAALVWSKAPVIVGAHDTGPLIRSRNDFWLTIPTVAAGHGLRGGRITPGEWERRTGLRLRFVYRRSGASLPASSPSSRRGTVGSKGFAGRSGATSSPACHRRRPPPSTSRSASATARPRPSSS
jgi:hypothetical protein